MEQVPLSAQKRVLLGKKVKNLRREGQIPAHVFGHGIPTIHVQVNKAEFKPVFEKVGETGIISLDVDKEKRPVMVRNIQVHPVSDDLLHIDFYQVNLTEKVTVNVPVEVVGEAPAVEKKVGLLLTPVSEIEIEALPADIPEKIDVDISKFAAIGDEIKVKDLPIDRAKVEVKTDEELIVAQIGELVTKEMEAEVAEMEAEAAEAAAEQQAEGAEPGRSTEGAPGEGEEAKAEAAEAGEAAKGGEAKPEENKESPAEGPDKGRAEKPEEKNKE